MKRYIALTFVCLGMAVALSSCRKEVLSPESVITVDAQVKNDFDKWLDANYVHPYNIQVKYRYEMNESDYDYYTIAPSLEYSIMMAHIVKYACIETYDEVAGVDFTRRYFPKMFFYTGEWEYKNNGTYILGTAEGGRKIFLSGLNYLPKYITSAANLNHFYLKTIHHEFTHILNQTKTFTPEFEQVTPTSYVSGDWSTSAYNTYYRQRGFLSSYSQESDTEDFAEVLSLYVTNTEAQLQEWVTAAGREVTEDDFDETKNTSHYTEFHSSFPDLKVGDHFPGDKFILAKIDLVRKYFMDNFNVDIDELRDAVLRRQGDIIDGKVDLTSLEIN